MTREEYEEKLKTNYPILFELLNIPDPCTQYPVSIILFGIECGPGWWDLIEEASMKIENINRLKGYNIKVNQIKEKFGGLRYYVSHGDDDVWDIIREAERKSYITCEMCGAPGKIDEEESWSRCRCEDCKK